MAGRIILGIANPALDVNGDVDAGATLTFYQNGTTTPLAVYTTADLDVALANPLPCDSAGRFPTIWASDTALYSVKWTPSGAAPITFDDIAACSSIGDAVSQVVYEFDTTTTLLSAFSAPVSLPDGTVARTSGRTSVGDGAGGEFYYNASDTTTLENSGTIRIDIAGRRWFMIYSGPIQVEWFGAKGDAQQVTDAVVTGTNVTSASHNFSSTDNAKVAIAYLAGATVSGARNATLITSIASTPLSHATLAIGATNNVASGGVFAWGTDDAAAINLALAAAGPTTPVIFSRPGYLMTDTLKIGNATSTWAHNIIVLGSSFFFGLGNNTSHCVVRKAALVNSSYFESSIRGGATFDAMGTGLDNTSDQGGLGLYEENVNRLRAWRCGWSRITDDSNYIQQLKSINPKITSSGLHAILNLANAASPSVGGFIDEIDHDSIQISSYGENNGAFGGGLSGNQRGAAIYSITPNSGTNNFIIGHTFTPALEINSAHAVASGYGSSQNPNAIFFADGTQANTLFGSNASAKNTYIRWLFETPQIEDNGGFTASGATFAAQTTSVALIGLEIRNHPLSGGWTTSTANISFTDGKGNRFSTPTNTGSVATEQYGGANIAQTIRAAGNSTFAAGVGGGLYWDGTKVVLEAKNWGTSAVQPMLLDASTYSLDAAALGNFANDGAAASGGVAVSQLYRNGSILMIRIT